MKIGIHKFDPQRLDKLLEVNLMSEPYASKYTLFDSVQEMLAPEMLSELLSKRVTRVDCQPMNGHSGLAGGQLDYIDTNVGRFVLKRMSLESDWIMVASQDSQCRAVRLWQYGLLDRVLPHLEHPIIAGAQQDHTWAMLMEDLTGSFFAWDKPIPRRLVPVFLDGLARLHATFWNDPYLHDVHLGLCDLTSLIDQTSPRKTRNYIGNQLGVLPDWITGGWQVMEELLDPDVFLLMSNLTENPGPLEEALSRYPFTLLHGDYRSENLAHLKPDRPFAIDWQEAACSLMTIDLAWFINWVLREGEALDQAVSTYRQSLEAYLVAPFTDADWQAMIDLGTLIDVLRSTCFVAYWSRHSDIAKDRIRDERVVKRRNQQVRNAMRWL